MTRAIKPQSLKYRTSQLLSGLLLIIMLSANISAAADLTFTPCNIAGSGGNGNLQAQCAQWQQPVNRANPTGPTINLFVAKLPSTAIDPAKDAFTLINGGPGGSSIDLLVDLAPIVQMFTRERDVIVIDQRGTGRSAPLTCDGLTEAASSTSPDEIVKTTKNCLDRLSYDPRFFTSTAAVADLEALRETLGYQQLDIYGISYGTRVAMQYQRRHPDRSRSIILDGVVPPTIALGSNVSTNSQSVLNKVFNRCKDDSACTQAFPDLEADFLRVSNNLKQRPISMPLQHPVTGLHTDFELTYEHFALWLRLALYVPETTALIPVMIHQAANQANFTPIAANALRMLDQLAQSINYGMHNSVICTEDVPYFDDNQEDFAALSKTYLGREMYDTLKAMCSVWPEGVISQDIKSPLISQVPTLVLSGAYDPITPPAYGDIVMANLSNAKHIIGSGQGHGIFTRGCVPNLVLEFVEAADVDVLDDSCTKHLSSYPFFVDIMGPSP